MAIIDAIYGGGVFRPTEPVSLPDQARVQLQIINGASIEADDDMEAIYEILDRRHSTGITDLAARHNEHQP